MEDLKRYIEELTMFLPLPFCIVNPLDIILGANQAFQELTEYEEMEIIGSRIEDLFSEKEKINAFQKKYLKQAQELAKK